MERLVVFKTLFGLFQARGDLHFRKGLKIGQAGVPPPFGFLFLDIKVHIGLIESFFINVLLYPIPFFFELANIRCPHMVMPAEFFPKGAASGKYMIPGYMVEPKQKFVGAFIYIGQLTPEVRMVL